MKAIHFESGEGVLPRARAFFTACPWEELSIDDLAAKFGCAYSTAQWVAVQLKAEGLVERVSIVRATDAARRQAA